jgi:hypothetical protein
MICKRLTLVLGYFFCQITCMAGHNKETKFTISKDANDLINEH